MATWQVIDRGASVSSDVRGFPETATPNQAGEAAQRPGSEQHERARLRDGLVRQSRNAPDGKSSGKRTDGHAGRGEARGQVNRVKR